MTWQKAIGKQSWPTPKKLNLKKVLKEPSISTEFTFLAVVKKIHFKAWCLSRHAQKSNLFEIFEGGCFFISTSVKKYLRSEDIIFTYEKTNYGKVKTLWEGHKIWKKSPTCFDKTDIALISVKTSGRFFQTLCLFQKSYTN